MIDDGFEEIFEREYPRLVRALRRADDDATDAVQEAFVQAFVRWNRVSRLDDPAGWVRRVAVNRILNNSRSRGRRAGALATLAARADATLPASFDRDDRLDVRAAVRRLPPQQRMAVALFYGGDLSVDDIADAMNISDGTVKSHLHAARQRLRELLAESSRG